MRVGRGGWLLLALVLLLAGCTASSPGGEASPRGGASPTGSPADQPPTSGQGSQEGASCPELRPTFVPEGFQVAERVRDGPGILVVYRDASGKRELSFLSGIPSDPHGAAVGTGRKVTIRGHEVEVFRSEPDTQWVLWRESQDGPCPSYSVIGVGLTEEEFLKVLAGVR